MEIQSTIPTSLPTTTTAPKSVSQERETAPGPDKASNELAQRVPSARESREGNERQGTEDEKVPANTGTRVELHVDKDTGEVFGRVVNRETGEEVREIPARELRRLDAKTMELLGFMIDKTV